MIKFSKFYIDPELQFPLTLSLLILVMLQCVFFCWGIYEVVTVTGQWVRQDQVFTFFKFILLASFMIIAMILSINFAAGIYLSYRIAEPLEKIRKAMKQISHGNLEVNVEPEDGQLLQAHTAQFNEMAERLRHLVYRDFQFSQEANESLTHCLNWLEGKKNLTPEERKELQQYIKDGKAKLSIINTFFMRGKEEDA